MNTISGLSRHLSRYHKNIDRQKYYDDNLKIGNNNCVICNKKTDFFNYVKGYNKFCNYCNKRYFRKQSKEYWIYNYNYTEEEAKEKISQIQKTYGNKNKLKTKEELRKLSHWSKEYWMNRGLSEQDSIAKVSNINTEMSSRVKERVSLYQRWSNNNLSLEEIEKRTNQWKQRLRYSLSKDGFIDRYGLDLGLKKYNKFHISKKHTKQFYINKLGKIKGQIKYQSELYRLQNHMIKLRSRGWSKISQELFWILFDNLKVKKYKSYFATNDNGCKNYNGNFEYRVFYSFNKYHALDFYIPVLNKCIEYDCDYWHQDKEYEEQRKKNILLVLPKLITYHLNDTLFYKNKDIAINNCMSFLLEDK